MEEEWKGREKARSREREHEEGTEMKARWDKVYAGMLVLREKVLIATRLGTFPRESLCSQEKPRKLGHHLLKSLARL